MSMDNKKESIVQITKDPLINILNKIIVCSVKFLAVLMVIVILWALTDVFVFVFQQMATQNSPFNDEILISVFGSFVVVLIAIEIFMNIVFYLKQDAIHVPLVLATALTAIARKVIIFDYKVSSPHYIYATAAVIFAVGVVYWLITKDSERIVDSQ